MLGFGHGCFHGAFVTVLLFVALLFRIPKIKPETVVAVGMRNNAK
jgi:hypothetical protein